MAPPLEGELRSGAQALGLQLSDTQVAQLLSYAALIQKWGGVYNLTALRSPSEILTHHLLDSLAVVPHLRRIVECAAQWPVSPSLLDVGSGAGLPGVVISITSPDMKVDCVDTVAKKAAFIQQVAATLKLPNLRGLHGRVEKLAGEYDVVTSRAFASLHDFVELSSSVLAPQGSWLALKGKNPADEIAQLPSGVEVFHVEQLHVPGLNAERCLIWLRRKSALT